MSQFKFFRGINSLLRQAVFGLPMIGCVSLLFTAMFSSLCRAQTKPTTPAWHPPATQTVDADQFSSPAPFGQPKTELTNLKPPRDIFTQRSPQPREQFAARPLDNNFSQPKAKSEFNLQNTMSEAFGGSIAKANLESSSFPSSSFPSSLPSFPKSSSDDPLSGLAETTAEKIGGLKDWMSDKTAGLFDTGISQENGWLQRLSSMLGGADIKKIGGSLSIVLGGYLGLVWLLRKINPAGNQGIPTEVLEVVGNAPLDNRQNLQLVRLGSKLLLMIHGPDGTQPIGEVTDPAEVDHLVSLCNGRTRTANSAISQAVNRHQSNQTGSPQLNLSANQQSNLRQLLSALDLNNHHHPTRSYEA